MLFKDVLPSAELSSVVDHYRIRHFVVPKEFDSVAKPKIFAPKPEQCIAFYPRGSEVTIMQSAGKTFVKPKAVLSGQYSERIDRGTTSPEFLMIQVVFQPGVLHKLIGISFRELHNSHYDLEEIFPKEIKQVNEELCNHIDYASMIKVIENFIHFLIKNQKIDSRPFDKVFELLKQSHGTVSLQELVDKSCLSHRQFERKFQDY